MPARIAYAERRLQYILSSILLVHLLPFPPSASARSGTIYSQQLRTMKYVLVSGGKVFSKMKEITMLTFLGVISGIGKGVIGAQFILNLFGAATGKSL